MITHEEAVEAYKKTLDYCTYRAEESPDTVGKNFCEGCPFFFEGRNWSHCFIMNGIFHTKKYAKECVDKNLEKIVENEETSSVKKAEPTKSFPENREILELAAMPFLCNVHDDNFPENFMELLDDGKTEDENGNEIIIWEPIEYMMPEAVAELIRDNALSIRSFLQELPVTNE